MEALVGSVMALFVEKLEILMQQPVVAHGQHDVHEQIQCIIDEPVLSHRIRVVFE